MRRTRIFALFFIVLGSCASAQSASDVMAGMSNSDRDKVVHAPEGWLDQRMADLAACRGPDDQLTRNGAATWRANLERRMISETVQRLMKSLTEFDIDGDAEINHHEMLAADPAQRGRLARLDRNGDGVVAADDLIDLAHRQIQDMEDLLAHCDNMFAFDMDQSGTVTETELRKISSTVAAAVRDPSCVLPDLEYDPNMSMIVLGVGTGVTVENEDPEVEVPSFRLGAPTPFLVMSREPVLWRYSADPEKVSAFIVAGETLGVVGVPEEKIIYVPRSDCTLFREMEELSSEAYLRKGMIANVTRRSASVLRMVDQAPQLHTRP